MPLQPATLWGKRFTRFIQSQKHQDPWASTPLYLRVSYSSFVWVLLKLRCPVHPVLKGDKEIVYENVSWFRLSPSPWHPKVLVACWCFGCCIKRKTSTLSFLWLACPRRFRNVFEWPGSLGEFCLQPTDLLSGVGWLGWSIWPAVSVRDNVSIHQYFTPFRSILILVWE